MSVHNMKRKAQPIVEEDEDDFSEISENEIEVGEEAPIREGSDEEEEEEEKAAVAPLKKKKKRTWNPPKMVISNRSKETTSKSREAAIKRAQQTISSYKKKTSQVSRYSQGSKGLVATNSVVELDFDELDLSDMQDNARQHITKKKNFPRGMVGVIVRAERIDFSKDHKKKDASRMERVEIVVDVDFIYDLQQGDELKRTIAGTEIDYSPASICLHLPKRYQDQLEGLIDLSALHGSLILCPQHESGKWTDKKDEEKSSIPLIMLFKSKRALDRFGLTLETYPSMEEFIDEGQKMLHEKDYETEGVFKVLLDYFKQQSERFYAKESHKSNSL